MTGRKLAMIFRQFFVVKKRKIHPIFDLPENGSKPLKKRSFNQMGLFRIEDPSILLGDHNYDLHFGHNQDEQERYPPSFLGKSAPNTIEKYEKKEKISSRNP